MTIEKFGRYEVKRPLGRGGMGVVYLGFDPQLTREVAIKVLPGHLTYDQQLRYRLEQEVLTVARLEHPCIVPVYDYGEEEEQPYVVMRYMSGGSLLSRITQNPVTPVELAQIIGRVARALDNAHSHNIIHRDIKPGNILFDDQEQAYLSDFGLAKVVADYATKTGTGIVGTPAYMSPEQGSGAKNLDGRSDIYGLGIIVYEALAGQLPYDADTPIALMMQHINQEIPSIQQLRPDLPPDYEIVIRQAMAKTPDQRYTTAFDLAKDLASVARGNKIEPRAELQQDVTVSLPGLFVAESQQASESIAFQPSEAKTDGGRWQTGNLLIGGLALFGFGLLLIGIAAIIFLTRDTNSKSIESPFNPLGVPSKPTAITASTFTPVPTVTNAPKPTSTPIIVSTFSPTPTAVPPSATPTRVPPSSTPTGTATPIKPPPTIIVKNSLIVDNFESYDSNADLNNAFHINDAWGANEGLLKLVGAPHVVDGSQALAFEFEITSPAPDHYSGFERPVPPQNWLGYSLLCFWIESDGSGYDLIIQFGEKESEVWKHTIPLSTLGSQEVCRTLSTSNFNSAEEGFLPGNNQIDLEAIAYYGFYVQGTPQGPGIIYVDNFHLTKPTPTPLPTPTETPSPTPFTVACAQEPQGDFHTLWQRHKSRLGCLKSDWLPAHPNPITGFFAEQPFENGQMFWSETGDFYLVTLGSDSGTWQLFLGDTSNWPTPYKSCEIPTPPGRFHPVRGFGGVWCTYDDIREKIGWGLKKEEGFDDLIQEFEGGFILRDSDGSSRGLAYVLFNDGTFIKVPI